MFTVEQMILIFGNVETIYEFQENFRAGPTGGGRVGPAAPNVHRGGVPATRESIFCYHCTKHLALFFGAHLLLETHSRCFDYLCRKSRISV